MYKQDRYLFIVTILLLITISVNAQTNIKINEVYSRGTTSDPDWIELYNLSNSTIDISGYKIYDIGGQSGTKPKKEFSSGTTIPANGFLVVVTDDTSTSGFGLSSSGETVWLENGVSVVIDTVSFPSLQTIESYSRVPNGANWIITNSITRGLPNIYSNPTTIVMNEIYSRGTTINPDWIEIYNPSATQIDISGYKIYDGGGYAGTKPKKQFVSGSVIPANGFLVVVTDDTTASGFGLSSSGEEVWLEDASGLVIDDVTFPAMDTTQSFNRFPDGTSSWVLSNSITRGLPNTITEIDENNPVLMEYNLYQNYPNPFNPTTAISFSIQKTSFVSLKVFNILGKEVANLVSEIKSAGIYSVKFNAIGLSSGIYFYQLTADNYTATKKFTLMK